MSLEIMLTINNGMNVYPIRTASIKLNLWDKIPHCRKSFIFWLNKSYHEVNKV